MPHPELLLPSETGPELAPSPERSRPNLELSAELVEQVMTERTRELEGLKSDLSLKFYYSVARRLKRERLALEQIFHLRQQQDHVLSRYSFALDPHYFEQRFLAS